MLDDLKAVSVIQTLQEKFPNEKWKLKNRIYENNRGEHAYWCSASAPRYDGDDDSFVSEFWIYRKDKSPERLWF